jgi:hypothetical protein
LPWGTIRAGDSLSAEEQHWVENLLQLKDTTYDPFARMLVAPAQGGPGSPSSLQRRDAHPVRLSLSYAAASLETGNSWRIERARDILRAVLSLQNVNPASPTYGTWPWYLEEPLDKMAAPDLTLAESCGASLLMVWSGNRKALGSELENSVAAALRHAARSIQLRNDSPAPTSIVMTGTGVVLVTAQEWRLPELRQYAKERLRALYEAVLRLGSFADYNSPTHTIVILQELSRMLLLVRDSRERTLLNVLHELAWKEAATHFHAPSQQWAGPHSHNDQTNLAANKSTLAFLRKACHGKVPFHQSESLSLSLDAVRLPLACPRKWSKSFATLDAARQVAERFVPADAPGPGGRQPVLGTTWLHPRFALGSINRGDFWSQRRPLVAYWGTPSFPRFLRARFLKNDRDFSSALFVSAQHQGHLLGAVLVATDHGDTHPRFDPIKAGEIRARDLRFSLDLGGALGRCTVQALHDEYRSVLIRDDEIRWVLRSVADSFDGAPFAWAQPSLRLATHVTATAYQGEEKSFKLGELRETFFCFTLAEWPYEQTQPPPSQVQGQRRDGRLLVRWVLGGTTLELEIPTRPGTFSDLIDQSRTAVV